VKRFTAYTTAVLAAAAMLTGTVAPAHADTDSYFDALSSRGVEVTPQSMPPLRFTGVAMCNEMSNGGRQPDDVAARWYYPNTTRQNLLDIARAAQSELCPSSRRS